MNRIHIGLFKGSVKELRQDLKICRQLQIPLLTLARLRKERKELSKNQEVNS